MAEAKTNETLLLTAETAPDVFMDLRRAVYRQDLEGLRKVLDKGLDLTGYEHLLLGVEGTDILRELLSHMDVHACAHHFFRAIETEDFSTAEVFLDCGAASISDYNGLNVLTYAKTEKMFDFLVQHGLDVKKQNEDGRTLAFYIHPDLIGKLKTAGLDLDIRGKDGRTAFFIDDYDRINALKEAGADIHVRDNDGKTPLFAARPYAIVAYVNAGVDVNAVDNNGQTALFDEDIYLSCAEKLLEAGIDVDVQDNNGNTALMCLAPRVVKPPFGEDDARVEQMSEKAQEVFYKNLEIYETWCCILEKTTKFQTENKEHKTVLDLIKNPEILESVKKLVAERGQAEELLEAQRALAAQKADNLQTVINGWNSRNKRTIGMFQSLAFLIETQSWDELQKVATFVREKTNNGCRQRTE